MPRRRDAFAALADPTRRSILTMLRDAGSLPAGEIAARFPRVSRPSVSKHLHVLREARLVRAHERGRERHYSLQPERFGEVQRWLSSFVPQMERSLEALKRQAEQDDTV